MYRHHKQKKRIVSFILFCLTIANCFVIGFADDVPIFDTTGEEYQQNLAKLYGWDWGKADLYEWTGVDGEKYERPNKYQQSMFVDVQETISNLCLDLGIVDTLSAENNGLYGGGGYGILAVARQELAAGVCEEPMGSDHTKYHDDLGMPPCAWCALFISWCAREAGLVDSGLFPISASCATVFNYLTGTDGFSKFKFSTAEAYGGPNTVREGDIVFWYDDSASLPFSHIGIVSGVGNGAISIISGNAGNRVKESVYDISAAQASRSLYNGFIVSVEYPAGGSDGIVNYLVNVMGTTVAGACGAMANIAVESDNTFSPTINEYSGGGGYGICQWTGSRKTDLANFCNASGLDMNTLDGQLAFLKHELETIYDYAPTYNALMTAPETPQGAYDAAATWCRNFERPSSIDYNCRVRGELAQNTYWPQYSSMLKS